MGAVAAHDRNMKVPFLDLRKQNARFRSVFAETLGNVVSGPLLVHGLEHQKFENAWADYCGFKHCVGVGNGYDALRIMLEAFLLEPQQNVIVASNTHISTWLAVKAAGHCIYVAEPHPDTFVLDRASVEKTLLEEKLNREDCYVLATNLYGNEVDTAGIHALGVKGVFLDAAQGHGLRGLNKARAVAFSFYPTKNLGALGDAGAICSDEYPEIKYAQHVRNYGALEQNKHEIIGCNSRLDEIQAAFLLIKLRMLDAFNARRLVIANHYRYALNGLVEIQPEINSVYHQFVIKHDNRDVFRKRLADRGVDTMVHYPVPPHLQPAFGYLGRIPGSFPVAERLAETCVSLPIGPELTDEQVNYVVDCIRWCA